MAKCPNCGGEVEQDFYFCKYCGTQLNGITTEVHVEASQEAEVTKIITERLNGIKNRDEEAIKTILDVHYTKFDDWSPFRRQEADEALRNEFNAYKVLSNYAYELKNLKIILLGDLAIATFHLSYQGKIRNRHFQINSRVTTILNRQKFGWKIVHEHFSRFPDQTRRRFW